MIRAKDSTSLEASLPEEKKKTKHAKPKKLVDVWELGKAMKRKDEETVARFFAQQTQGYKPGESPAWMNAFLSIDELDRLYYLWEKGLLGKKKEIED